MCLWWEVASGRLPAQAQRLFTGFQDAVRLALQLLLQPLPQAPNITFRAVFRAPGLSGPRPAADGRTTGWSVATKRARKTAWFVGKAECGLHFCVWQR